MKKKKNESQNFLDYIPKAVSCIRVVEGEDGMNHLDVLHERWADKLAQKIFKKPCVTHVSLEKFGSFIWPYIDGDHTIYEIACLVKEEFGEEAEPVYERIADYFRILKEHGYVTWVKEK